MMPTNPQIVPELITPCSLNAIELLATLSKYPSVGHTVLRALAFCGPFAWQSNEGYSSLSSVQSLSRVRLFVTP